MINDIINENIINVFDILLNRNTKIICIQFVLFVTINVYFIIMVTDLINYMLSYRLSFKIYYYS